MMVWFDGCGANCAPFMYEIRRYLCWRLGGPATEVAGYYQRRPPARTSPPSTALACDLLPMSNWHSVVAARPFCGAGYLPGSAAAWPRIVRPLTSAVAGGILPALSGPAPADARLAQLDRVLASEAKGRRFESGVARPTY